MMAVLMTTVQFVTGDPKLAEGLSTPGGLDPTVRSGHYFL